MMKFKPFTDEVTSLEVAGMTFENHIDRISIYGQLTITKDQQGLAQALDIQSQLNAIITMLNTSDLSVHIENKPVVMVDNPFQSN
jgi:hypothetical protein